MAMTLGSSLLKRPECPEFPYCSAEAFLNCGTGHLANPRLRKTSWSVFPLRWSLTSPVSRVFGCSRQRGSWTSGQQQAADCSGNWPAQVSNVICPTLFRTAAAQIQIILVLHKLVKVLTFFKYCH